MTNSNIESMERESARFIDSLREELGKTGICQLTTPYLYALRQAYEAGYRAGSGNGGNSDKVTWG